MCCIERSLRASSSKSWSHGIRDVELVIGVFEALQHCSGLTLEDLGVVCTYAPEISHDLIQSRGKCIVDVEKDTFGVCDLQGLPNMCHDVLELLCAGHSESFSPDGRCRTYWSESDNDLLERKAASSCESGSSITRETHENRRCRHGKRQIWG